jgi:hypothetical protein
MHPALSRQLTQARIADLHRQAQRDAMARAASQALRMRAPKHTLPPRRLPTSLVRRVLSMQRARPSAPAADVPCRH